MTWARFKTVSGPTDATVTGERVFNLAQLQWWTGHGRICELQFAAARPVYVAIQDKRLEMLTGSSGHYASD